MNAEDPPFVVDLHAHFPMQFDGEKNKKSFRSTLRHRRQNAEKPIDKLKFLILEIAVMLFDRERIGDGPAVTIDTLTRGNCGVALSVLYDPVDEFEIFPYPAPPHEAYFDALLDLLDTVEREVAQDPRVRVVRDFTQLLEARAAEKVALVHVVEGGFHIGLDPNAIEERVAKLAHKGVAYVTVAHLFHRMIATNAAAIPFMSDSLYHCVFPQDVAKGLDDRGRRLVRAMVERGILIDVTHMSKQSMRDTFAWLDEVDPDRTIPVIASHVACRIGSFEYNLEREFVRAIADRKGVCGVIYCDHYVRDGRGSQTTTFDESLRAICTQIDKLRDWGGDDVLAIGSDLDGFIKHTLAGLSSAADHRVLAAALHDKYGGSLAAKICHGNAMRVLEDAWMKPRQLR